MHTSSPVEEVLIHSIDDVVPLFGVPFNSLKDIDEFTKDLEVGKYDLWLELTMETRIRITDIIWNRWDTLLNFEKSAPTVDDNLCGEASPSDTIVQSVDINTKSTSYPGAAGASAKDNLKLILTFVTWWLIPFLMVLTSLFHVKLSKRLVHVLNTLYMVTLLERELRFRLLNTMLKIIGETWVEKDYDEFQGFFFFKFNLHAGLEAVLEGGPWLIRKSPIILKKWSMDTRLLKEELTCIPIWVKLHDVPIQVFEEDGISLIATFIGKPVMLNLYTSSMCNDSWGRSSFAWCLIKVNLEADLVDVVTIGIPSLTGDGFTKETIHVEYEWKPPRCDICKIFSHVHDHCLKKVVHPPIVTTSTVVTPTVEKSNDGFQTVGKKKKRKGKSKSTNGGQFAGPSVKQTVKYEPHVTTSAPKKRTTNVDNVSTSSSMLKTTEDEDEAVEYVYDESASLFPNTKAGGNSSFTAAAS
uniref:Zinc knuckle CX2CX4HX4C n=1 Tax=Tanacetum cinerariifolium TaxID=118510 RepID=A0A6L2N5A9_TANCI|nr:zinc knuckle CX2CX4HX4C [Tanacetum cinerariifolium]